MESNAADRTSKFEQRRAVALSAVLAIILMLGFGFLGGWLAVESSVNGPNSSGPVVAPDQQKVINSESELISKIVNTVGPSVVSIDVTTKQQASGLFGLSQPIIGRAAGTGIILNKGGLIITNRHVVPQGATKVSVTLSDGTKLTDVKVIGRTNSGNPLDVAFLQVQENKGQKLRPASLGNSSKMEVGDRVLAIGNALGHFQNTVTFGIISGHGRSIIAGDGSGSNAEKLQDLFQTDAAINPGNSGGPLVNMKGQVVGINTAVAGEAQNIGFSIPINDVKGLIVSVEDNGRLEKPYIGVHYVPLTKDYAYVYNLPVNRGAYIAPSRGAGQPSVAPGSPADRAGLKEKDIITKVNGVKIDQNHSLVSLLYQHQPGDQVTLTILRDGHIKDDIKLTLGKPPKSATQ